MASRIAIKATLILFNFLVWLSVGVFLALGIFELTKADYIAISNTIEDSSLQYLKLTAYILICIGIFLFLVGFIGCCGSLKEDKCLLAFYMICLVIVIFAQSILVFVLFISKQELMTNASTVYIHRLRNFNYTSPSTFEFSFHQIQLTYRCCGIRNSNDYSSEIYPGSCCGLKDLTDSCNSSMLLNKGLGCFDFMLDSLYKHIYINSAFLIGFLSIELISFIFGILLCQKLKMESLYDNYKS